MSDFVLDASVALAMALPGTAAQEAYAAKVWELVRNGAVCAVPDLFIIETVSVLLRLRRRRAVSAASYAAALAEIDALEKESYAAHYSAKRLAEVAKETMLQGYDAVYLDLARKLAIPLASLDRGHRSACRAHGVKLLDFQ